VAILYWYSRVRTVGVYLIDAKHLGTQYDRLQIVDVCGTQADEVSLAGWA